MLLLGRAYGILFVKFTRTSQNNIIDDEIKFLFKSILSEIINYMTGFPVTLTTVKFFKFKHLNY